MKKLIFIPTFLLIGCASTKKLPDENIMGIYMLGSDLKYQALSDDRNYSSLEIRNDGTYLLKRADILFTPVIEQCEIASKGKWSIITDNVIEITSEDYFIKQKGFNYDI